MIKHLFRAALLVAVLSLWRALAASHRLLVEARADAEAWRQAWEREHASRGRADIAAGNAAREDREARAEAVVDLNTERAEHAATKNALKLAIAHKDEANEAWQNERGRVVRFATQHDAVHAALGGGDGEPIAEVVDRARRAAEVGEEWRGEAAELRGRLNAVRLELGLAVDPLPASAEVDPLEARMLRAERDGYERRRQERAMEHAALESALTTEREQYEETAARLARLTAAARDALTTERLGEAMDVLADIVDETSAAPLPTPPCPSFTAPAAGAPATPTDEDRCVCGATRGEHRAGAARVAVPNGSGLDVYTADGFVGFSQGPVEPTREERIDAAVRGLLPWGDERWDAMSSIHNLSLEVDHVIGADANSETDVEEMEASLARLGAVEYEGRWSLPCGDVGPISSALVCALGRGHEGRHVKGQWSWTDPGGGRATWTASGPAPDPIVAVAAQTRAVPAPYRADPYQTVEWLNGEVTRLHDELATVEAQRDEARARVLRTETQAGDALRAAPPDPTTGDGWRVLLTDLRAQASEAARRAAEADQARALALDDAARAALNDLEQGRTWQELRAAVERATAGPVGEVEFTATMRRMGVESAGERVAVARVGGGA